MPDDKSTTEPPPAPADPASAEAPRDPDRGAQNAEAAADGGERPAAGKKRKRKRASEKRKAEADGGERKADGGERKADGGERKAEADGGERKAEADGGERKAEADGGERKVEADGGERKAEGVAPASMRRARGRVVALIGVAALVVIGVMFFATRSRGNGPAGGDTRANPAGGAMKTPAFPTLPGQARGVRLTGAVVDGAGLPVAGAEVSAELERGAPDRALAPAPRTSAGSASDAGPPLAAVDAGTAVTVAPITGADGRFVVDGLVPGRFRVRVTGAGLLPAEVRYVPVPSDEARIVVARQVAIEGTVTDGGKPVANATVGLRGDAIGGTIEMRTTATGAFQFANLPEGRYQLFAWQAALAARTLRVARLGAGPFGAVELRLEAASIVVGRVIDRDEGTGLAAAIELRPSGDDQAPRYVRSGDDGVFRIEGVPNGAWIADAFVPGYLSPGGIELEAGRGVPEIALVRGGAIEGRVLDGEGRPVAGASVRALLAGGTASEVSADVDRDKLRRFSGRTAAPVPLSPAGSAASELDDGDFVVRGELGVLVGPIPPIPPPGAHVAQTAVAIDPILAADPTGLPGDPGRASIWTTGADGSYRIRGFARGKVTVLATASGFAEARSRTIAIDSGQVIAGVDLVLTPGTRLVGKISDQHGTPVIGARVTATPVGASSGREAAGAALDTFTDEAGAYTLGPVTGTVELRASAYGHGEAERTIELAPAPGTTPDERREDLVLVVADARIAGILEDATGAAVSAAQLEIVGGVGDGRRAVTAADGTFTIDQLPAGRLRLHVAHPAYPADDVEVTAASGNPARARLRLPLGGGVEGALLDAASGAPIASVTLVAAGPGTATAEASTDKAGRWKLGPLRPGRWRIAVQQPGYLPQRRDVEVPVAQVPGGTSVRDVRLELARGALLGGTVRDARGQRVAAAQVTITSATGSCEGSTDGQGEFRIRDCPTGELDVVATKASTRGQTRATIRPGDEVLGLALELR